MLIKEPVTYVIITYSAILTLYSEYIADLPFVIQIDVYLLSVFLSGIHFLFS